jgi:hypothetical protein
MGLFSRRHESEASPRIIISGQPQAEPEVKGSLPRRSRMFVECMRCLGDDPLATQVGRPIGDGFGLDDLVGKIRPLFAVEQSLIRWVALRGALSFMYIHTLDPESRSVPFSPVIEETMGICFVPSPDGQDDEPSVVPAWGSQMTEDQQEAAVGVAASVGSRVVDYPRISSLTIHEVIADPPSQMVNAAIGLDIIAWSAIALLRTGIGESLMRVAPQPDALPQPGWYIDPLWAKAERYWDGSDWTDRCRASDGRRYVERAAPLA